MKRDKLYIGINCIVLLMTVILFIPIFSQNINLANKQLLISLAIFLCIAIAVHVVKGFRLWFAMYGKAIPFSEFVIQYCKVVPVSVVLPFKSGDLFRAYCFGHLVNDYLTGVLVILLDRFCDTLALVGMLLLVSAVSQLALAKIFYVLLIFLLCVISCYWLFPAMYHYWNHYFVLAKASKRKIWALKVLQQMNTVYQELSSVVKGRCLILIALSFLAWMIELGGLLILANGAGALFDISLLSGYLTAVLTGAEFVYLQQFIVVTVLVMMTGYIALRIGKQIKKLVNK